VSDTLADAFMSRTEPIAEDHLARLAQRLANLEDYLPQDGVGESPTAHREAETAKAHRG